MKGNYSMTMQSIILAIEVQTSFNSIASGPGRKVVCPIHGHKDRNLYVADGKGRVVLYCHSRQCDPKDILESVSMSISDVFYQKLTPVQQKKQAAKQYRCDIESPLYQELIILCQYIGKRKSDRVNKHKIDRPEFEPFREEPWEREVLAAKRVINALGAYYGI